MTTVDEPMPEVALKTLRQNGAFETANQSSIDRLTGIDWLRDRLKRGRYSLCGNHYHAECTNCDSVKCLGKDGYSKYASIPQYCDCIGDSVTHIVGPFTTFGEYVGFP